VEPIDFLAAVMRDTLTALISLYARIRERLLLSSRGRETSVLLEFRALITDPRFHVFVPTLAVAITKAILSVKSVWIGRPFKLHQDHGTAPNRRGVSGGLRCC
jgi:hypothetical protein